MQPGAQPGLGRGLGRGTWLWRWPRFLDVDAVVFPLRCVCDQQRSFALGIQWIVVRTLGTEPPPSWPSSRPGKGAIP